MHARRRHCQQSKQTRRAQSEGKNVTRRRCARMNNAACIDFYSITRAPDDVLCGFGGGWMHYSFFVYVFMALRAQKATAARITHTHLQMQSARRANGLHTYDADAVGVCAVVDEVRVVLLVLCKLAMIASS
jgi:hypothetical protein